MTHLPATFRLRPLSAAIMLAALSANAAAVPVNWVPNADGFWDVGTNWSSNPALPGAADDVTIDVGGATVRTTTFRSGAVTINSLTSQENLALSGGTLTINGASTINAGFTQNGGTMGGAGNLTVSGASTLGSGVGTAITMTGAGTTRFDGTLDITGTGVHDFNGGRTLLATGITTWSNAAGGNEGQIRLGTGSRIENQGLWIDNTSANSSINNNLGAGSFLNSATGVYQKTGASTVTISTVLTNDGALDVQNGTMVLSGGGALNGSLNVATGSTLQVSGGTLALNSTSVGLNGRLQVSGGTVNQAGVLTPSGSGLVELGGGTLNIAGAVTAVNYTQNGGTLGGAGNLTVSGAASLGSAVGTGTTMTGAGTTRFNGALAIIGSGVHDFSGGRSVVIAGPTTWTNAAGNEGQLRLGFNVTLENQGLWQDNTTVNTSINSNLGGGTFINSATGTYRKNGANTVSVSTGFTNNGAIDLLGGTLALSGGGTLNGSFNVATGTTLQFGGGSFALNSTALSGNGRLLVSGGTVNQSGVLSLAAGASMELSGGTFNIANALSVATFTHSGGTLGGAGDLTVSGTASLGSAVGATTTMTGAGTTRFDGPLAIFGSGVHDFNAGRAVLTTGTTTWTNAAGNDGQIRFGGNARIDNEGTWLDNTSVNTSINSNLGGGSFNNTASGVYQKNTATTVNLSSQFNNDGLVDIQAGTLILSGGGTHSGDFQFAPGAQLSLSSGTHNFLASSSLTGDAFTFSGGTVNMAGTYNIGGTTTVSGGNNSLAGATVLDIGDTLVISGGSLDLGALAPSITTYTQSGGTLNGTGTVTVSGASTMGSAVGATTTMTGAGTTRFDGALGIIGSGVHDFTAGRTLLTTGTTTWTNAAGNDGQIRFGGNARIENQGTWLDNTSVNTSINPNLGGGSFTNTASGVYQKNTATTVTISSQFNNDGLVDIQAGNLILSGGGTHSGDFVFAPGTQLSLSSGTHNFLASSSLTGDAFTFSGGTVNMAGTYDISGTTTVSGGNNSLAGATVLDIGDTLVISGGSLDLGALSPSFTTYTQSGGTLNGTGTVTVSGASTMGSAVGATTTMTGAGTTRFDGAFAIIGSGVHDFTAGRTLLTTGTTTWTNAAGNDGQIRFGGNARIENQGTWLDNTSVNTTINPNLGGGSFTNTVSGVYQKNTATTVTISSQFNNDGLVDILAGSLTLTGGGTHNGDFVFAPGAQLNLSGGTHNFLATSSLTGDAFTFSGGTVNMGGTYDISGSTTVTGGNNSLVGATVLDIGDTLVISGGSLDLGALAPSITTYTQSGGTLNGTGTVTVSGASTMGSVVGATTTMTGAGTTRFDGAFAIIGSGVHDFTAGRTLLTTGTTTWTNAAGNDGQIRFGGNARIENQGTWLDNTSVNTSINPNLGGGSFTNTVSGVYQKNTTTTTSISSQFSNDGLLDLQAGTMALSGGGTLNGDLDIATGATLQLSGSTFALNSVDVALDGRLLISGGTVNQSGTLTTVGDGLLELSGGTLNVGGSVSVGTYTQSGGTLGGAGNLTVRGAATLGSAAGSSTTMLGAGTTSFEASLALIGSGVHDFSGGRTALLLGDTTWTNAAGNNGQLRLGFNSRIENHGLWLDNTSISTTINPSLGGGVFVIAANGTYRKATTTTTTVSAALDNLGAVDVQDGTFTATGNVAQQVGNTLAGGAWRVSGNGVLNLDEAGAVNFTTNQGDVTLDGASASFARINTLTTNQGAFRLLGARNFTAVGAFANSGVLQLGGGTFNAPGLSNSAAGEIFGFGTITPVVINSGIVRASGGTLTASNGIDGQSGTLQSDAGATLALGANSDGDFLVNNGTLALGTANVTVAQDYTNGNFGVGNSFDARANVTGTGQILASGDVAQALTGAVSNGGTANASMAFGNIHVGDVVTQQYSIANSGSNGPALRGAIQTNVNGGNLTDGRLSGSGVTAGNFGPVAAAGAAVQDVTFTGSTAGALSGQSVAVVNNFDNVAEQVLSVSGAVFRYANPSAHTPEPINFGNRRVGDVTNQVLSLTNDVPNDGFSERLDASIGGVTGTATSNGGSFSLLNAGATDSSSLAVGIDTASAGHKTGTATITLTSNGAGTSDLGSTALGAQTVNVSGDVFRLATASAHTPEPVVFANRHVGDGASQALSLTNTAANDGFSERLNASIGGVTGNATSNNGSFSLLNAGATDNSALSVGIDTSSAGHKSGTATINLASDGTGTSGFAALGIGTQTVNVSGDVFRLASASAHTPEPVNFGNRRVGDVTSQAVSLTNNVANDGFSERLDASIGGVTGNATSNGGSFSLLNAGATNNSALAVGIDTSSAGHKAGTATITLASNGAGTSDLGSTALGAQTVNVSGDVFRLASASAHSPEPVVFANRHVGDGASQALNLTNTAANDGFSERLNASIGGVTGNVTSNNGSFSLLNAGATDNSALSVGIDTSSAGHKSGTATINLASDGTGTSGFAALGIGTQTVNVSGDVFRLASASALASNVVFANRHVGESAFQALSLTNTAAADGFSESLDAAFTGLAGDGVQQGSVQQLAAGQTSAAGLIVGINTGTAGHKVGSATVTFTSNGAGSSDLGLTGIGSQTVNVVGDVYRLASAGPVAAVQFGNVHVGDVASRTLSLTNTALADGFSESLDAAFSGVSDARIQTSGSVANLAAGASDGSSLVVGLDTSVAGSLTGFATLQFTSNGAGTSGLGLTSLGSQNVGVTTNVAVYRFAEGALDNVPPVDFGAHRVGDVVGTVGVTVRNLAANDGFSEALNASVGSVDAGFTANGNANLIAAGSANGAGIQVGLDTATAGVKSGNAHLAYVSDGAGTSNLGQTAVGGQDLAMSGRVYGQAVASVETTSVDFGIVHVGDLVGPQGVTVRNLAVGSLTDNLLGSVSAVPAGFTGSGSLGAAGLAQNAVSSALSIGLDTSEARVLNGNATLTFVSHNDEMADLALGNQSVALQAQVNNFANPTLAETSGDGSLSNAPAGHFVYDFGQLTSGAGSVNGLLALTNFVTGPADSLGADFEIDAGSFALGGFGSFAGLGAGGAHDLSVSFNPLIAGLFEQVVRINLFGENASGFHGSLGTFELTLRADVQAVPVPGAVWMLGSALAGLAGWSRRRKAAV